MSELFITRDARAFSQATAVCLGAFDGFHLGHRALIECARKHCPRVAVVTFDPHPARVLAPTHAPELICGELSRERVLAELEVSHLVLLPFTRELAQLSPKQFVDRYLLNGLRPTVVVVGHDFRFGHRREGDVAMLRELLAGEDIAVQTVDEVPAPAGANAADLSSTSIRRALDNGDVASAGAMLGRWHAVTGRVVEGHKRGRELGYPTANVAVNGGLLPAPGIYATVFAVWDKTSPHYGCVWPSVSSLGRNPTFTDGLDAPLVLEAHVLDQDLGESLYGLEVEVSFVKRLRDEAKFDSLEALVAQIEADANAARKILDPATVHSALAPPS